MKKIGFFAEKKVNNGKVRVFCIGKELSELSPVEIGKVRVER
tara:strand:+ start:1128 stop:1253 length:126 start_codon:yes stop_codon:yes gene_type:complete